MKKLLRFIPALALAAALLTVTALACSPDDNNPEHHENVIQTDEKKPTCLQGGGAASFPSATSCPTNSGRGRSLKSPPAQKPARSEPIAVHATSGIQSSCRQRATAGISTIQKSLPAPRQENTTPTAGIALRARGAPQNLPRVTFGSSGSEYLLHAPRRDIPNLSATTAARMGGPPRRPPRDTASARGSPQRRLPARRKACRSGSAQPAA